MVLKLGQADLNRVLNYVGKDLRNDGDWKVVNELVPRQVVTM